MTFDSPWAGGGGRCRVPGAVGLVLGVSTILMHPTIVGCLWPSRQHGSKRKIVRWAHKKGRVGDHLAQ